MASGILALGLRLTCFYIAGSSGRAGCGWSAGSADFIT